MMFDANQTQATPCYPNLPPGCCTTPPETHSGPQQHSSKRCLCNWFLGHRPCRTTNMAKRKTTTAICKNNHYSNHYSKLPCQLCQFAGAWWGRSYKLLSKLVRSPVFLGIPWAWRMTILRNCKKSGQQPLRNKCQQNMRIPQIINSPRVSQNRNCKGTCRIYYIFWKTTVSVLFFHIYIYIFPLFWLEKTTVSAEDFSIHPSESKRHDASLLWGWDGRWD